MITKERVRLRMVAIGLLRKGVRCGEIAKEFNVTREWIRQVVPDWRLFFPKCKVCGKPCSDAGLLNQLCRTHQGIYAVHGDPEWKPRGDDWRCACGATKHAAREMCARCYRRFLYATRADRRAAQAEAQARWRAKNPERSREIQRRAHRAWVERQRGAS